jgi:hypothetical protein
MGAEIQTWKVEVRATSGHRLLFDIWAFSADEACSTAERKAMGRWATFGIHYGNLKSRADLQQSEPTSCSAE